MADELPKLSAAVGPKEPYVAADLEIVRKYVNLFISKGYLPTVQTSVAGTGTWDADLAAAIKAIELAYFYGEADPNNKLENGDTLFEFLLHVETLSTTVGASLSVEVYHLAALMVPGGADYIKRTIIKTKVIEKGKTHIKKEIKEENVTGYIRTYLPEILKALTAQKLNDTDMLMMALGTVRAEASAFRPVNEGISKYNTSPVGTEGRAAFDLYEGRADLGNVDVGDGASYKGRGFVQLTGHANYTKIGGQIGVDLENDPDQANDPAISAKILAQYLKNKETSIRAAIAANNLSHARKLVNGGSHGLGEFRTAFAAGRRYLGIIIPAKAKAAAKKKKTAAPAAIKTGTLK